MPRFSAAQDATRGPASPQISFYEHIKRIPISMSASSRPILVRLLLVAAYLALLPPGGCHATPAAEALSVGEPWRTWLSPRYKARMESRLQRRSAMRGLRDVIPSRLPATQQRLSRPPEASAVAAATTATTDGTTARSAATVKVFIGVMVSLGHGGLVASVHCQGCAGRGVQARRGARAHAVRGAIRQCSDLPWGLSDGASKQVPPGDPTFGWGVQATPNGPPHGPVSFG